MAFQTTIDRKWMEFASRARVSRARGEDWRFVLCVCVCYIVCNIPATQVACETPLVPARSCSDRLGCEVRAAALVSVVVARPRRALARCDRVGNCAFACVCERRCSSSARVPRRRV